MKTFLLLIISFLIMSKPGYSQAWKLQELDEIEVLVENLHPDAEEGGVTRDFLQQTVELRLRQNDIKVVDETISYLYLNCNIRRINTTSGMFSGYSYNVLLSLNRPAYIYTNLDELTYVDVWKTTMMGFYTERILRTEMAEVVKERVDVFLNDYLEANND